MTLSNETYHIWFFYFGVLYLSSHKKFVQFFIVSFVVTVEFSC